MAQAENIGDENRSLAEQETAETPVIPEVITIFVDTCKDVAKKLRNECRDLVRLQEKYRIATKQHTIISDTQMSAFLEKLAQGMLLIPVIGPGSSGKSTLLNAILGEKFLPFCYPSETVVRVYIQHDHTIHVGRCNGPESAKCSECPKLYDGFGDKSTLVAEGVGAVHNKLAEYNSLPENEAPKCVRLLANIPCIKAKGKKLPLTPFLADCEGAEYLSESTEGCLKVVTATILVHPYTQFLQNRKSVCELLELVQYPKAEILVAVTWFDHSYDDEAASILCKNPTAEEIKKALAEVKSQESIIRVENVFPVCSRWALTGRIVKQSSAKVKKQIIFLQNAVSMYDEKNSDVSQETLPDLAIKHSGILEIEARIGRVIEVTDHSRWCCSILVDLQYLLSQPLSTAVEIHMSLQEEVELMKGTLEELKQAETDLNEGKKQLKDASKSAAKECEQLNEVLVVPQHNAMKAVIDDLIEEFFKHWKRTSEDSESCSVKEFLKGILDLLQLTIPAAINKLDYNAAGLAQRRLDKSLDKVEKIYKNCLYSLRTLDKDPDATMEVVRAHRHEFVRSEMECIALNAVQRRKLLGSFREAVAANKHGLPFLIVTAISMVTVVAIPWALKVFKETQAKTQLEELLKRGVDSPSLESLFETMHHEDLEKSLDSRDIKEMEEEVKKFATEETYLDSLADDYRKTTLKSITEPYAVAVQNGAKTLRTAMKDAEESTSKYDLQMEKMKIEKIEDDIRNMKAIIDRLTQLDDRVRKDYPFEIKKN